MLEDFESYLKEKGYKEFTPSGKPSTVYDYKKRVEKICERENINIKLLSENINHYVDKYGPKGVESEFGKKSNNSFINALKRYEDFIKKENHYSSTTINKSLFKKYWAKYKDYFRLPDSEQSEKYKWSVLKQVFDNWDWDSEDKVEMFKNAFEVSGPKNLWLSGNFYPISHTSWMLDNFKVETINQFNNLFNEDLVLLDRVNSFISFYDEMLPKLQELVPDKTINYHSHGDLRAVALYLSLQYPEKYFLFKYGMVKDFCQKMELPKIKRGKKENLDTYINISNQVLSFIKEDNNFIEEYRNFTNKESNYNDANFHLLTQDFIYTVANHFEEEEELSFIHHFGVWLDTKTEVFHENLLIQVKRLTIILTEENKIEKASLDALEENTLKVVLKEFKQTEIITDKNSNYFKEFLKELILESNTIFELYKEYLIETRSDEIQHGTITNYVDEATKVIPERWEDLYGSNFEDFEINYRNLQKLEPTLRLGFSGYMSFMWFINELLEKYELKFPLNQILYGPPGTGKTYKTKELAVKIIDGFAHNDRQELLKRYEELIDEKQIHFTTFHQSMSYEDFIEGIKPKMNDENSGEIEYEIRSGLFKKICELANKKQIVNFEEAYGNLIKDISESDEEYLVLKTPRDKEYRLNVNSNDNLNLYTSKEIKKQGVLSKNKLQRQFEGENVYEGWEGYANGVLDYLEVNYDLYKQEESIRKKQVIIIDEINRGNVSAIFGELITLIEEDKRAGKKETIQVTLPYSQEKFSVPNNVFIIGTMNTADRSVEALDTALRRRFSFEEILPQPQLLADIEYKEVNLEELLDSINQRIELLIDKDHQIGHSYFFNVTNFEDLKLVFKDKIIPLLEEYFYGDFGKIGLVLGENFIVYQTAKNKSILAPFKEYDDIGFVTDKNIFRLKPIANMEVSDFISIYLKSE